MSRVNPFASIYLQQNDSSLTPEQSINKRKFPIAMDIELTNHCNFRCRMCNTGSGKLQRSKGFMSDYTWDRLMGEISETKMGLRFTGCGEPMLHPKFLAYIEQAKKKEFLVHITTNASLINTEIMDRLITMHVDSIKFSFQGVDRETYNEMRLGGNYDRLFEAIKKFYVKRGGKLLPYFHLATTLTDETPEQIESFRKTFSHYVDYLSVGITLLEHFDPDEISSEFARKKYTKLKLYQEKRISEAPHFVSCPEIFDKLNIWWDGGVTPCCNDYEGEMFVGNIHENSLMELWNCEKLRTYREILSKRNFDAIPLCRKCVDYMKLHSDNNNE